MKLVTDPSVTLHQLAEEDGTQMFSRSRRRDNQGEIVIDATPESW
jgi:hypothetical protein